ncbi:hypothetical protein NEOLI_000123 [Neolecta irregularis DAH-3]|uniref:Uncharacterized protein n=1 Tax=Neolecta irregularis (strain DAH-3) TaxID=1198029 RepID=A0A1U7LQT6_NEOID|nr:hypothetical protein NEOLI_000123 [Neolecta irregularis DAH-3]|eukprot:OLL25017.1 hypothetical protein NEOLI_000123 [Neolecta irregularis DAH-3]
MSIALCDLNASLLADFNHYGWNLAQERRNGNLTAPFVLITPSMHNMPSPVQALKDATLDIAVYFIYRYVERKVCKKRKEVKRKASNSSCTSTLSSSSKQTLG